MISISVMAPTPRVFESSAYADDIDDFEGYVQQAIQGYWNVVRQTVKDEREKIAPTQIKQGLENAISISQQALKVSSAELDAATADFNHTVASLDKLVQLVLSRWAPGQAVDLGGFEQLLRDANDYERQTLIASASLSRIRAHLDAMHEYMSQYTRFCDRNVPRLRIEQLSLTPFVTKRQPGALTTDPRQFMDDPVAKSYAITTGAASFAAGIAIYAAVYGWDAAATLFAVEAGSGTVTVGSSSPVGWIILVVAVVAAYYVGMWQAKQENEERERRARQTWSKLMRGISEAQAWFQRNRLRQDEYIAMAASICRGEEVKEDGRLKKIQSINATNLSALEHKLTYLEEIRNTLDKNNSNLGVLVTNYEMALIDVLGQELIATHRAQILSEERVSEAIRYYNDRLKPIWNEFADYYTKNIGHCSTLSLKAKDISDRLKVHRSIIDKSYKDSKNALRQEFAQIENMTRGLVERIDGRVRRCSADAGAIPPDIYATP